MLMRLTDFGTCGFLGINSSHIDVFNQGTEFFVCRGLDEINHVTCMQVIRAITGYNRDLY